MARVEVRFLIDANGILNVTARDARTGREQSVEVKPSYGLTDEQVEAMIEASIDNAEADYQAAQLAGVRVDADAILTATEKAMRDPAWLTLTDKERADVSAAMNRLRVAYNSEDHNVIRAQIDNLNHATHVLAENMMNTAVQGALKGIKLD